MRCHAFCYLLDCTTVCGIGSAVLRLKKGHGATMQEYISVSISGCHCQYSAGEIRLELLMGLELNVYLLPQTSRRKDMKAGLAPSVSGCHLCMTVRGVCRGNIGVDAGELQISKTANCVDTTQEPPWVANTFT